jgi:cytochrome b6-f complex iron-sulfur subunit
MNTTNKNNNGLSRRKALKLGVWAACGVLAGMVVYPLVRIGASNKSATRTLVWLKAMELDDMPEAGTVETELNSRGGERPDTRVFITRSPDGTLTAKSALCTHLGCLVSYNRVLGEFVCPCHGGRYNMMGEPIGGPPDKPLADLPAKTEDGWAMVGLMMNVKPEAGEGV